MVTGAGSGTGSGRETVRVIEEGYGFGFGGNCDGGVDASARWNIAESIGGTGNQRPVNTSRRS